jgi:arylsulfatase A-like enzyme
MMRMFTLFVLAMPLAAADRPNIVFIFSDDHAYQAISAYGDHRKLIDTPHIDRIAGEGIRFDRCLVPNSICGPSRATVLTGKYSHKNGFYNNTNSKFDGRQPHVAKYLQAAGYQTALVGKWHLVSDPTGFDHWKILPGQGIYYNPPMITNGARGATTGYVTDLITDASVEWLDRRDKQKPFLLMMHHKAPHREWAPPLRHLGHNRGRVYPEPDTLFDDYAGRGPAEKNQDMTLEKTFTPLDAKLKPPPGITADEKKQWDAYYEPLNRQMEKAKLSGKDLVKWRYQRYMHDYLGCVKAVDESVGRMLKYLDDHDLAKNTLVVYASDQGFYLGEHGWFDKRWIFEESLRTPCVMRYPGVCKPQQMTQRLTSNLDFAPTFMAAAGLPVPADMQGASLLPIMKGSTPDGWRNSFYYHYYEYPGPHSVAKHYGVVTDRYKLVHFYEGDQAYWELFDRKTDPRELKSVYGDDTYAGVKKELHAELVQLRKDLDVPEKDAPETNIGKKKDAKP